MKFIDYLKEFETESKSKKGFEAWEIVEKKHYQVYGKFKYISYQSFKTMKSRKKNQKI